MVQQTISTDMSARKHVYLMNYVLWFPPLGQRRVEVVGQVAPASLQPILILDTD